MTARRLFTSKKFDRREERLFAREKLIYNTTEDILIILEKRGISKQELAKKLGKSRSFVTQVLSGARNMTLGTLSDVCFELDLIATIKFTGQALSDERMGEAIDTSVNEVELSENIVRFDPDRKSSNSPKIITHSDSETVAREYSFNNG